MQSIAYTSTATNSLNSFIHGAGSDGISISPRQINMRIPRFDWATSNERDLELCKH
jgi:hypothetical protein